MSFELLSAFLGKHFDPVFAQMAVASHAAAALEVDVPSFHGEAREAVARVAEAAASEQADPSLRTVLIQGVSGFGKTHSLVTALLTLAREGKAYPAVMQLSAKVEPEGISLWLLQKVVDELGAGYFRDAEGRTPLKRLGDALWAHAPEPAQRRYRQALDGGNREGVVAEIVAAVPEIRKALAPRGLTAQDGPALAALLLLADASALDLDRRFEPEPPRSLGKWLKGALRGILYESPRVSGSVHDWLRGSSDACIIGPYVLRPLASETERQGLLLALARIAVATGAPLILALDQIEAIPRIGGDRLLPAIVTTALQLVESTPRGVGLVLSALTSTFNDLVNERIDEAFRQRLVYGESPVILGSPEPETVRAVLDRRVEVLLARAGLEPGSGSREQLAPDWVWLGSGYQTLRDVFDRVRKHRDACRRAGRFLEAPVVAAQPAPVEPAPAPSVLPAAPAPAPLALVAPPAATGAAPGDSDDFDSLWEDLKDADLGAVTRYSDYDRQELFLWLAEAAVDEVPAVGRISAEASQLQDAAATRVIDLSFFDEQDEPLERWQIALTDAPNSNLKLRQQITSALARASDARPALLRLGPLPGIGEDGRPDREPEALRRLQSGPALVQLFAAGGRVALTAPKDWHRLNLARRFVAERGQAAGFGEWRRQRRFLLDHAGIGPLTRLVQPEGAPVQGKGA